MRVLDCIIFFARLKGLTAAEAHRRATSWIDRMGLGDWRDRKVETLSKGTQQKVQFVTTVLHDPDLLVLDEPFAGLDPVNQQVLRDTVLEAHRRGRTILFSTHIIEHAEQICEHVCIIARGHKVLDGRLEQVKQSGVRGRYAIELDGPSCR